MTTSITTTPEQDARRRRTVIWVVGLAFTGLVFDGYDLVVYGAVLSTFLRDPSQIGTVTPALGGALGSYALVGVLVGALLAGTHRRRDRQAQGDAAGLCLVLGGHGRHRVDVQHHGFRTDAVRHRPRCRSAGRHHRRDRLGVRATREEEPLQRHHLLRGALREPDGRIARHPPARGHRLAGHVLDRGPAVGHVAAAGLLQDARVTGLAAVARSGRGGPRHRRANRRAAGRGATRPHGEGRQARAGGLRRSLHRRERASRRSCWDS